MTDQLQLIRIKLEHSTRMREHLAFSLGEVQKVLLVSDRKFFPPNFESEFERGIAANNPYQP